MFPWSPEFVWDTPHVVFFGALYSVLATILTTLAVAAWRVLNDGRHDRLAAIAWHADFEELPGSARACRHSLTGEAPGRTCENGFDCRRCDRHPVLEAMRLRAEAESVATSGDGASARSVPLGFDLPPDRLYHRGHTWARLEPDGTVGVGIDEIALRLVGQDAAVALPSVGTKLALNGCAARIRTRAGEVRVLSPLEGTVVACRGTDARFTVQLAPSTPLDTRHLLQGGEARVWALRELERLQRTLGAVGAQPALADGGELVADIGAVLPADRYDALLGQMLLEP